MIRLQYKSSHSLFCSKTQWQMFLMVSGRHVGAQLDGHQHGVSIQISINLGKNFLRISSIRKFAVTWIWARVFAQLPSFFSPFLDFIYWTVLIIILIYFEWRDCENHQHAALTIRHICRSDVELCCSSLTVNHLMDCSRTLRQKPS